jgi:hypothetical protein
MKIDYLAFDPKPLLFVPTFISMPSGGGPSSVFDLKFSTELSRILHTEVPSVAVEPFGGGMRIHPEAMRLGAFYPAPLGAETVYVRRKEDGTISLYRLLISGK